MSYSKTQSLCCPYCDTKSQFVTDTNGLVFCSATKEFHDRLLCTNCNGLVVSFWDNNDSSVLLSGNPSDFKRRAEYGVLRAYHPIAGSFAPQVNLSKVTNGAVRKDYKEAIDCYNNGFFNASMVMARRAIHQEIDHREITGANLFEKINTLGISEKLKALLNKVKNFGNAGAHPDFFLYDTEGNQLIPEENEQEFALLSLTFLDKYFQDQYELDGLINNAPNSEKENRES